MASPPEMNLRKVPAIRSMRTASALLPAARSTLAISAWETVRSAVTTRVWLLLSTRQAVPATSAPRIAWPTAVSWVALNVLAGAGSCALAVGMAMAPTATSPDATAISRVRLATPLRGWCARSSLIPPRGIGGPPVGSP